MSHWIPFFFNFTGTQSNYFVFKFPSVRLQCHSLLLFVVRFRLVVFVIFLSLQGYSTVVCRVNVTISTVVVGLLVLDDVEKLLSHTITTSSIVDGVEDVLSTRITSVILEFFLHSTSVGFLCRIVLLPANPDSPNPTEDHLYEQENMNQVTRCLLCVCLCHRDHERICVVVCEFTHLDHTCEPGTSFDLRQTENIQKFQMNRGKEQLSLYVTRVDLSPFPPYAFPPSLRLAGMAKKKKLVRGGCESVKKLNFHYNLGWSGGGVKIKGGVEISDMEEPLIFLVCLRVL